MGDRISVAHAVFYAIIFGIINYIVYKFLNKYYNTKKENLATPAKITKEFTQPVNNKLPEQQAEQNIPAAENKNQEHTDIGNGFVMVEKKDVENACQQAAISETPATKQGGETPEQNAIPEQDGEAAEQYETTEQAQEQKPEYYRLIGAQPTDPQEVIDAKCLEMKRIANPLNGMDLGECALIRQACNVLGNPESRKLYDAGNIDPFISQAEFNAQFIESTIQPTVPEVNDTMVEYNKAFGNIIRKRKAITEPEDERYGALDPMTNIDGGKPHVLATKEGTILLD